MAVDFLEAMKKDFVERMNRWERRLFSALGKGKGWTALFKVLGRACTQLRPQRHDLLLTCRLGRPAAPRLKAEVGSYCGSQEAAWRDTNAHTQEALSRLEGARQLVRSVRHTCVFALTRPGACIVRVYLHTLKMLAFLPGYPGASRPTQHSSIRTNARVRVP